MDLMKLIGTVLAVCCPAGCALKGFSSQRICRRGTERPCYKIVYHQDTPFRVGFEEARQACRKDDGELLSIETESEQKLIENFVRSSRVPNGDFWIGLRIKNQDYKVSGARGCSSQYYWLDETQATFRNWLSNEPSCDYERCVALYNRPSAAGPPRDGLMFKWIDINCNSRNNFICKYAEENLMVPTSAEDSSAHSDRSISAATLKPVTVANEKLNPEFSESSVSLSDDTINISYILLATVPILLLLILVVSVVLCYRVMSKKRKEQNDIYAVPGQWVSSAALKNSGYPPTKRPNRHVTQLEYMSSEISRTFSVTYPKTQSVDYENVPSSTTGFVTNDIYETCRTSAGKEAGWVENDIYG